MNIRLINTDGSFRDTKDASVIFEEDVLKVITEGSKKFVLVGVTTRLNATYQEETVKKVDNGG